MIDHYNYLVNTQLKTLEYMLEQKSELVLENVTEFFMICPVTAEDKIPEYQLQHITYFDLI